MEAEQILSFWFGNEADDVLAAQLNAELWWGKNRSTDDAIRNRFESLVAKAAAGELAHWETSPRGRLALILLTDQFPRSIYRDSPRAFACDAKALGWCLDGLERGLDRALRPIERVFFYLPLEHAEQLEHQERSVALFRQLTDEIVRRPQSETTGARFIAPARAFEEFLDFAVRHRDIIARFGRFPHRNEIIGRKSTAEELAFLAEPGSSF